MSPGVFIEDLFGQRLEIGVVRISDEELQVRRQQEPLQPPQPDNKYYIMNILDLNQISSEQAPSFSPGSSYTLPGIQMPADWLLQYRPGSPWIIKRCVDRLTDEREHQSRCTKSHANLRKLC